MFFSDDMKALVSLFQKHQVEFAVCGGFAVAHYGFVRATMDFDLLVTPGDTNGRKIMAALNEFGFGQSGVTVEAFLEPGAAITLGSQPNQIDLLTSMSSQPTEQIIGNAQLVIIKGLEMKVVSYEDLLFAKKTSGRPKDRIDFEELTKLGYDK
jgi:predicted nucleotidyltransferase